MGRESRIRICELLSYASHSIVCLRDSDGKLWVGESGHEDEEEHQTYMISQTSVLQTSELQPTPLNLKMGVNEEHQIIIQDDASSTVKVEPQTDKIIIAADLKNKELLNSTEDRANRWTRWSCHFQLLLLQRS